MTPRPQATSYPSSQSPRRQQGQGLASIRAPAGLALASRDEGSGCEEDVPPEGNGGHGRDPPLHSDPPTTRPENPTGRHQLLFRGRAATARRPAQATACPCKAPREHCARARAWLLSRQTEPDTTRPPQPNTPTLRPSQGRWPNPDLQGRKRRGFPGQIKLRPPRLPPPAVHTSHKLR